MSKKETGEWENFRMNSKEIKRRIARRENAKPDGSPLTLWHYFPWFTRDQEAQFLKLYAWRENTSSEADSPMLKQEQKAFVMRSIYDPAAADELDLITRYEQLGVEIEQAQKRMPRCRLRSRSSLHRTPLALTNRTRDSTGGDSRTLLAARRGLRRSSSTNATISYGRLSRTAGNCASSATTPRSRARPSCPSTSPRYYPALATSPRLPFSGECYI